jgi:hypothetical protein
VYSRDTGRGNSREGGREGGREERFGTWQGGDTAPAREALGKITGEVWAQVFLADEATVPPPSP